MKFWNFLVYIILTGLTMQSAGQKAFSVGERTLLILDSSRSRPLKTELWYPTPETDSAGNRKRDLPFILGPTILDAVVQEGKHPLILLSHGTGGNRFGLAWLAFALAKQGFIVAAPDHWGNTYDNKILEYFVRSWERPMDLSFLLSYLLSRPEFARYIDDNNIGAAGFSLGGYSVLALAGAEIDYDLLKRNAKTKEGRKEFTIPEYGDLTKLIEKISFGNPGVAIPALYDPRINCFVAISPALGLGFNNSVQMEKIKCPVLIIGTGNDQIAPVATNARHYHDLIGGSRYYEFQGKAGHYVFLNMGDKGLQKEAGKYYSDDKTVNREKVHKEAMELIVPFLWEYLNREGQNAGK